MTEYGCFRQSSGPAGVTSSDSPPPTPNPKTLLPLGGGHELGKSPPFMGTPIQSSFSFGTNTKGIILNQCCIFWNICVCSLHVHNRHHTCFGIWLFFIFLKVCNGFDSASVFFLVQRVPKGRALLPPFVQRPGLSNGHPPPVRCDLLGVDVDNNNVGFISVNMALKMIKSKMKWLKMPEKWQETRVKAPQNGYKFTIYGG